MNLQAYFITSANLYKTKSPELFEFHLENISLHHNIDKACFRDNSPDVPINMIDIFTKWCNKYEIQSFINLADTALSIKFAKTYKANGVHIKGKNLSSAKKVLNEKLATFYSAHSIDEGKKALDMGIDFITLSPIFDTPNKGIALGVQYLCQLDPIIKSRTFALGGIIDTKHIQQIQESGIRGFASIRYFEPPLTKE